MVDMEPDEFRRMVDDHVARYVASGGEDGATFNGWPCVVLTTIGARSGLRRHSPIIRVTDPDPSCDDYVAIASMGGAPTHPSWFHNIVAHPDDVELQDRADTHRYRATVLDAGPERDRLWNAAVAVYPPYATYQERTDRVIPVIRLTRSD